MNMTEAVQESGFNNLTAAVKKLKNIATSAW